MIGAARVGMNGKAKRVERPVLLDHGDREVLPARPAARAVAPKTTSFVRHT